MTMTKSEMAVSKLFSAQWIMATGVTLGATFLTFLVIWKRPEHATVVLTVYMSNWGIIIANYFRRDKTSETTPTSIKQTTETTTKELS